MKFLTPFLTLMMSVVILSACSNGVTLEPTTPGALNSENLGDVTDPTQADGLIQRTHDPLADVDSLEEEDLIEKMTEDERLDLEEDIEEMKKNPSNGKSVHEDEALSEDEREEFACRQGNRQGVLICHIPPGNPASSHEKCKRGGALRAHLGHGDTLGPCLNE